MEGFVEVAGLTESPPPVLDPGQQQFLSIDLQHPVLVEQQIEAHLFVDGPNPRANSLPFLVGSARVVGVVVVAKDAEFPVSPCQRLEAFDPRLGFIAVVIDQIPREAEDVGIQGANHIQPGLHSLELAKETAQVGVGDLDDAQTVESIRKAGHRHLVATDVITVSPPGHAVGERSKQQARCSLSSHRDEGAPGHIRTVIRPGHRPLAPIPDALQHFHATEEQLGHQQ